MSFPFIPYGRQAIDEDDIAAVVSVLRSDWLTTGPMVDLFEQAVAKYVRVRHGVAVANGTAALHAAMHALGIGPGDQVIVPPMTFAATANCVLYEGATPVFADVDPQTLCIDPEQVRAKITPHTRAIIGVDYAGQSCRWDELKAIAHEYGLKTVADGCHALGAAWQGQPVGTLADMTVFSFHPVKHITTGEGGMVVTDDDDLARRMRIFRTHGITTDQRQRQERGSWFYEMQDLGYNYRLTDIQCALGLSQLKRLDTWIGRRREIAAAYDHFFGKRTQALPLHTLDEAEHAYHLYVIRIQNRDRDALFMALRDRGIGVNVHYIPVHLHPYYRRHLGTGEGLCPQAEAAFAEILSLPIFPGMTEDIQERVCEAWNDAWRATA